MSRIYWIIFFFPIVIRLIQVVMEDNETLFKDKEKNEKAVVILTFGIIIIFAGLRSWVADTTAYIISYKNLPDSIAEFNRNLYARDWMFYFISCCFKSITKASYQWWLFIISLINGVAFGKGVYKYSKYKWLSCYLFVSGALFTYFFNGMRQFIAMSILFCNTDLIFEHKKGKLIALIAVLSLIHGSAWFFLPTIFLFDTKPWSKQIFWIILSSVLVALFFGYVAKFIDTILSGTQYSGMGAALTEGAGSKPIRIAIAMVPVGLAFFERKFIEQENDEALNFYVNCAVMYMSIMIVSTFSFGIYVGRVAAYYEMYSILLLPRLTCDFLEKKTAKLTTAICVIMYFIYFYYQMEVVWHLGYASKVLGIF